MYVPTRTDRECRKLRLIEMGLDPETHIFYHWVRADHSTLEDE